MRRFRLALLCLLVVLGLTGPGVRALAHPMPNSVIEVAADDAGATLDIAIPLPELRLALPEPLRQRADLLSGSNREAMEDYFDQHIVLRTVQGARCAHRLEAMSIWRASDATVGDYEELRLRVRMDAQAHCDSRAFVLAYDAVIHQVANHWAVVRAAVRPGVRSLDAETSPSLGIIAFDFRTATTPPLKIDLAAPAPSADLRAAIALGFHHVLRGLDHLLFLLALLVVAPLRVAGGRWSSFQDWSYTLRRFVAISAAFTLGHSIALLLGVYAAIGAAMPIVEVAIAASILVAALHAIRPLFPAREWLVAALFGTVHGLAFSETLAALRLPAWDRALTVLGFNIGVEGAQLVAMACAVPLLLASRWAHFDKVRLALMSGVLLVAIYWAIDRINSLG